MKGKILAFCLVSSLFVSAQTGNYFLSHFIPGKEHFNNNVCFDIAQDDRGLFYFAIQGGVLRFDGRTWDVIRTSGAVYALEIFNNQLYVAGSRGFGKIEEDRFGNTTYVPIYEEADGQNVFQMLGINDQLYFLSDRHFFVYSFSRNQVTRLAANEADDWLGLHEIFGNIFVSTESRGVFTMGKNSMVPAGLLKDTTALVFAERHENQYLLGTADNRLFLCEEDMTLREIPLADIAYVSASVFVTATWVNRDLVALGTLRGGVVFINPATGATEEIINYSTGLPDNEIYMLAKDRHQHIWAAHTYGFTRIAPYLPFRSYRYYAGLQGNLLCATRHNNEVYVGTSLGLYKLVKEEFYDEITYFVDVPIRSKRPARQKAEEPPVEVKPERKGGLFAFLRKKKPEGEVAAQAPATGAPSEAGGVTYRREKRTKRILRSSHYAYKKLEGIDAKVTQLVVWNGRLLSAGLNGVNEIASDGIIPVLDYPTRYLFASAGTAKVIISTYDDKIHEFVSAEGKWIETRLIKGIEEPINYVFDEPGKAFWFCGLDKVYRMATDSTQRTQHYAIPNARFDRIIGTSVDGQPLVVSSSGFFKHNASAGVLEAIDSLPQPEVYFTESNRVWFNDDHGWFVLGESAKHAGVDLLNLFAEIRFISHDKSSDNLWIITGNNELLQFDTKKLQPYETSFPLFLRSMEQGNIEIRKNKLRIDQENSALHFRVVKPDYIGARSVEYRYFLEGLNPTWTEWSANNNQIDIPYLPNGEYTLKVQAKDIFGRITEMDPLLMEVLPPYWKRSWFYALEFVIFASLVILSFRLSNRFRYVSMVLSLLSIIILIEFIQTAAGSTFVTDSSPVVEFLVQVGIAFLILPVELFLRKFMLQSIDKRGGYAVAEEAEQEAQPKLPAEETESTPTPPKTT
jgi:hypothetical protein